MIKEYKINEYITLKLKENGKTVIYVGNESFLSCITVILNIPKKRIEEFDDIDSIDQIIDVYKNKFNNDDEIEIAPEEEFFVHCSNLQTWVEHDYDTRILHKSLSFPLLKKLTELGDPVARKVFKDEICKRMLSGDLSVILFLLNEKYHEYLNNEEREIFFLENNVKMDENIRKVLKNDAEDKLLEIIYEILLKLTKMGDKLASKRLQQFLFKLIERNHFSLIYDICISHLYNNLDDEIFSIFKRNNFSLLLNLIDNQLRSKNFNLWEKAVNLLEKLKKMGHSLAKEKLRKELMDKLKIANSEYISVALKIFYNNNKIFSNDDLKNFFLGYNEHLYKFFDENINLFYFYSDNFYIYFLFRLADLGDKKADELLKIKTEEKVHYYY
ncbi:MAG: hypothetical protein ACTSQP_05665 [Promethearchaeota archaeon]